MPALERRDNQGLAKERPQPFEFMTYYKQRGILSLGVTATALNLSFRTVAKARASFEGLGFVREFTGKQRNRLFSYQPHMEMLGENTERK